MTRSRKWLYLFLGIVLTISLNGKETQAAPGYIRIFAQPATSAIDEVDAILESNQANAYMGGFGQVANAGDVNGDDYADVIIGADFYDFDQPDEGGAFVYYGGLDGVDTIPNITLEYNQAGAHMGGSVSGAGDVNGDGYADMVVGAPYYSNGQTNEGAAFVYYGEETNPITFTGHIITNIADGVHAVYAADLDNDGDVDVLSASHNDDKIAWYENSGESPPNFISHIITTDANWALSVYAADVNGDGNLDVLSASADDNTIAWYENNGILPPTFTPHIISTSASYAVSVYAADVDGDGNMDVLSASAHDRKIAWYENTTGDGSTFVPHVIATTYAYSTDAHTKPEEPIPPSSSTTSNEQPLRPEQHYAKSVYAVDVDADGDIDVLSASYNDHTIAWYENTTGDGSSFAEHIITTSAIYAEVVRAADINGDGNMDVLSASTGDNKIAWYENSGETPPTFTPHIITTAADGAKSVCAADVDSDGDIDVLSASSRDNKIAWYENDGASLPAFTPHIISTAVNYARPVYATDIDGDGDVDVVSGSNADDQVTWWEQEGRKEVPPFRVLGMEVTQGIQCYNSPEDPNCPNNSVPLIADKPTKVRVYVASNTGAQLPVQGTLYANNGVETVGIKPEPLGGADSSQAVPNPDRENIHHGLWFPMPQSMRDGLISVHVEVYTSTQTSRVRYPTLGEIELTFNNMEPLRIGYVSIEYKNAIPDETRIAIAQGYLESLYPLSEVDYFKVGTMRYLGPHLEDGILLQLKGLYDWYNISGWPQSNGKPDQLFGWVPDETWGLAGSSTPQFLLGSGRIACGSDTPLNKTYRMIMAHEIGHNLGLCHPICDYLPFICPYGGSHWPHNDYAIHDVGFDFDVYERNTVIKEKMDDFMIGGHCGASVYAHKWISAYTFQSLYTALANGEQTMGTYGHKPLKMIEAGQQVLLVSGRVYTDATAELDTAYQLTTTQSVNQSVGTDYCLDLEDIGENILSSNCFDLSFIDPEWAITVSVASFVRVLPYNPAAARVVLKKGSEELIERFVSSNAPTVTLQMPNGGETISDTVNVAWTASDIDGDSLSYVVSYSADEGQSWYYLSIGITETQMLVDTTILQGSDQALFRVMVSDGINTAHDVSDGILTVPTHAPEAYILSPEDEMIFTAGQTLLLRGRGYDLEDGILADDSLTWTSSLSGTLGNGRLLDAPELGIGTHVFKLTVMDSDANTATATITVTVVDITNVDITKSVKPQSQMRYGDELTYTIVISAAPGVQVGFYDPLLGTTFQHFVEPVEGITYTNNALTGTLTIIPSEAISLSFVARIGVPGTAGWTVDVTNRACVYPLGGSLDSCIWSNEVTTSAFRSYKLYLPLMLRNQ